MSNKAATKTAAPKKTKKFVNDPRTSLDYETVEPKKTVAQIKYDARRKIVTDRAAKKVAARIIRVVKIETAIVKLTEKKAELDTLATAATLKLIARLEKMDQRFAAKKDPEAKKKAKLAKAIEMVAKLEAELAADSEA